MGRVALLEMQMPSQHQFRSMRRLHAKQSREQKLLSLQLELGQERCMKEMLQQEVDAWRQWYSEHACFQYCQSEQQGSTLLKEPGCAEEISAQADAADIQLQSATDKLDAALVQPSEIIASENTSINSGSDLEVTNLRHDIDHLESVLTRMVETHQTEMSVLQRQLHGCSSGLQQGLDTVTRQLGEQAEQADCLVRAFRHHFFDTLD